MTPCLKPEMHQWSFLVSKMGCRWYIITQVARYKWYILLIYLYISYHLLREPETAPRPIIYDKYIRQIFGLSRFTYMINLNKKKHHKFTHRKSSQTALFTPYLGPEKKKKTAAVAEIQVTLSMKMAIIKLKIPTVTSVKSKRPKINQSPVITP